MNDIKIGFSRPVSWKPFSWLIMTAYGTNYDHVYVRLHSSKYQRDMIYQASGTMVNFMSPNLFASNNVIVKEISFSLTDENYTKLMQFCIDNAGKPYGVKDILGLAWVRIAQLCGRTIKNPFNDGGATYVCSELVSTILVQYMADKLPKDTDDMTPQDVYNYILSLQ